MPENANRRAHLYAHAVGRYRYTPDRERDLTCQRHPDWPQCPACGWPVHPVAGSIHPTCEEVAK